MFDKILPVVYNKADLDFEKICQAHANGDGQAMGDSAHRLKGASANIAVDEMSRRAAVLESMGWDGNLDDAGPAIERLREEIERYKAQAPQEKAKLLEG